MWLTLWFRCFSSTPSHLGMCGCVGCVCGGVCGGGGLGWVCVCLTFFCLFLPFLPPSLLPAFVTYLLYVELDVRKPCDIFFLQWGDIYNIIFSIQMAIWAIQGSIGSIKCVFCFLDYKQIYDIILVIWTSLFLVATVLTAFIDLFLDYCYYHGRLLTWCTVL